MAKHQANLCFLKLVLQSLCASWKTNIKKLTEPIHASYDNTKKERPSITSKKEISGMFLYLMIIEIIKNITKFFQPDFGNTYFFFRFSYNFFAY